VKQYIHFETERLILKASSTADAEFVLELCNTPKWLKYIGDRNIKTVEDAEAYITSKMHPQQKSHGYSNYTVIRKSDNAKMGSCGLYDRDGIEGIEIGFAFLPDFEKKGYAFESASKLLNFALNDLKITEISAVTTKDNISSQKLLEKLGLKLEGPVNLPEDDEELLLFKLVQKTHK